MNRKRKQPVSKAGILLAAAMALTLAACTPGGDPDPDPIPGTLVVIVNGLPSGAEALVTATGPSGVSLSASASETFTGLPAGSYQVSAQTVDHEGVAYAATVTGSPAAVEPGGAATATVNYLAVSEDPGELQVSISGLPDGVDAQVSVSGPDGFSALLTASGTLSDLDPGSYSIEAADVDDAGDAYAASVSASPVIVPSGGSVSVTVSYTFLDPGDFGSLDVSISGLPDGADADVSVTGPSGFSEQLAGSSSFSDLVPGYYQAVAANVTVGDLTYAALISGSPALVLPDETATITVQYQPFATNDGDAASNPGVHARFRVTSGPAVWVDQLLFNAATPLDVRGIQLRNELGRPDDLGDWLAFQLVHGQGNSTTIRVSLACVTDFPTSPIRAALRNSAGNQVGQGLVCGGSRNIAVPSSGANHNYVLEIVANTAQPFYADYVLSVNAYCPQHPCSYVPYED